MIVPVISADLEKGHFTKLAKYIARHWPFGPALKLAEGQALLSKCFGYRDLHDVQQTAKSDDKPMPFSLHEAKSLAASVLTQAYGVGEAEATAFVATWSFDSFGFVNAVDAYTMTATDYEKIRQVYLEAWRHDDLLTLYGGVKSTENPWPHNLKTLIHDVADAAKKSGVWLDASTPILEWFGHEMGFKDGRYETVGKMAYRLFAKETAENAIWSALSVQPFMRHGLEEVESSEKHNERLGHFLKGDAAEKLIDVLWCEAEAYLATMTLGTLFRRQKGENKFYYPGFQFLAESTGGWIKSLRKFESTHALGTVILSIARPADVEKEEEEFLSGYVWDCQLKSAGGDLLAYAAGSLYVRKPRALFIPGSNDTLWMADAIGEDEVVLMHSAFQDREGPKEKVPHPYIFGGIFVDRDIATVSFWERSSGASKGAGRECLREALKILKKKHKRMGYLIIDGRPLQFCDWTPHAEVQQIAVGKYDATLTLEQYISFCELEDFLGRLGEVHVTVPLLEGIPDIDLKLLGKYQVESFEPFPGELPDDGYRQEDDGGMTLLQ